MTSTTDAPADTTMMRIVHDALRRDLARARTVLEAPGEPNRAQRRAVGAHLRWMMEFLHAHHLSEDRGLYPLVRERAGGDQEALAVLDRMDADHRLVVPAAFAVDDAASELTADPSEAAAVRTVGAIDALAEVLLPHLRAEEDEAMPIVAQQISDDEWQAIEQEHNLDPKSMSQLGFEGHWLIDDASDQDRATVLGLVPPVPRFVLLHGFGHRYRRHAARCWGGSGVAAKPPRRVQMANQVTVTVDAAIDDVWAVVRDVTRVGEWSNECVGAEWLAGAGEAAPGARFRGRNCSGVIRWGRVCEIVTVEPHELVWRTVPTRFYPDSSEWRLCLAAVAGGTTITQSFRVLHAPKVLGVLYALMIPSHRDRTAELEGDLRRLGDAAGRVTSTGSAARP